MFICRRSKATLRIVRFPSQVEQVADDWNGPDDPIDTNIQRHTKRRNARDAISLGRYKDVKRDKSCHNVAKTWDQADDRIETKTNVEARDTERAVH